MQSNSIKLAYIGGGSHNWAWSLMSDLAKETDIGGLVSLYDIDYEAALGNENIGNRIAGSPFRYKAERELKNALSGADFVLISILPGSFEEMRSDVHLPEEYGIYQAVGDTTGPGGIVRAMRTIPMYRDIALAIQQYAPKAWVINYTNPMAMCTDTLYRVFPGIKAFGCCHEVFGTQELLGYMLEKQGIAKAPARHDVKINVLGINHFTWITEARWQNQDLMPLYRAFVEENYDTGVCLDGEKHGEQAGDRRFSCENRVKFDLFRHAGAIAAAGDRHLAEFCPGSWYLQSPGGAASWGFGLTPVEYRVRKQAEKNARAAAYAAGQEAFVPYETGEEGVLLIKALLGLGDFVSNVNLPNQGQVENLPRGHVVETNALFTSGQVVPLLAGALPGLPHAMTMRVSANYRMVVDSSLAGELSGCLHAFLNDPLVPLSPPRAEELFARMVQNTKPFLQSFFL